MIAAPTPPPFALSLSKGHSFLRKKGKGFDKLSLNGDVDRDQ